MQKPSSSSFNLNQSPISSSNRIDPQSSIVDRNPQPVIGHAPPITQAAQPELAAVSYFYPHGYSSLTIEPFGSNRPEYHFATAIVETDDWFNNTIPVEDDNDFDAGRVSPFALNTLEVDQKFPYPSSLASITRSTGEWIVDSGASRTIYVDGNAIVHFEPYKPNEGYTCQTSEGRILVAKGQAIARINLILGNRITDLDMRCEYVPEGPFNLLSTTRAYYDHAFG
jgi:hypothetical protein